ncbi:MAG TPA: outer membrane beta-barrel domain-containing protein [Anaeromyxobacteraceae bacterium]
MTRPARRALLALAALAAAPAPGRASEADAFEGKVAPVSGQLYRKAGRLEVTPGVGLSLNDAFFSKVLVGGGLAWHVREWLFVGGSYATGFSSATGSTQVCPRDQPCAAATPAQLAAVPGEVKARAAAELGFAPVYAKVAVLAETVAHFDLSLSLGADWISYREVLPAPATPGEAVSPRTASTFGAHAGLGARIFLAQWGALRLEVKDVLYRVPVGGEKRLQQQLLLDLGISVFLPPGNRGP